MPKIRPKCRVENCERMGRSKGKGSYKNVCAVHEKEFKRSKKESFNHQVNNEVKKVGIRSISVRQMLKNSR